MCGIFGAKSFNNFERLYVKNKQRGTFSHGFMYVKRNGSTYIRKDKGATSLTGSYAWTHQYQYDIFLGHTQAPTSSTRDFSRETSHPFDFGKFTVAHNGVLENHIDLAKEHRFNLDDIKVDSQVIPMLLDDMFVGSDVLAIKEVCGMLKGIYSCWIFCKETKLTYVVRSGSTLYTNKNKTTFSSVKFGDTDQELEESIIYCFTTEGLTPVGDFKSNNPFFII